MSCRYSYDPSVWVCVCLSLVHIQTVSWLTGLLISTVPSIGVHSEAQPELSRKYGGGNFGEFLLASTPCTYPEFRIQCHTLRPYAMLYPEANTPIQPRIGSITAATWHAAVVHAGPALTLGHSAWHVPCIFTSHVKFQTT